VLGMIGAEEIIAIATDALVLGSDSPSLRELAGTSTYDVDDVPRLLEQTARELGFRELTKEEALRVVSADMCQQITSGEVRPYERSQVDLAHRRRVGGTSPSRVGSVHLCGVRV
jgi:hypothetical protein